MLHMICMISNVILFMCFTPKPSCVQYLLDWESCSGFDGEESEGWLNDMKTCLDDWLENESDNEVTELVTECDVRVFDQTTYTDTVVSEWDLVCENKWMDPIISSIYLSGNFFGALIFGPLSDKIGRVNGVQGRGPRIYATYTCIDKQRFPHHSWFGDP